MNKHERELRELWTAAGVTPERQDALIAEITAKAQPGAKVGPFTIAQDVRVYVDRHGRYFSDHNGSKVYLPPRGPCDHNEMVPNDSTTHVWKCAKCGHVYGESGQ